MKKILLLISLVSLLLSCATTTEVKVAENTHPQIISEMAYEQFNNRRYKEAIAYYQVIIDRFDKNINQKEVAWAYYEIGYCYYYQKKYKEAIEYFNIVLKDFAIMAPRILAQDVLNNIYKEKPKLKPEE